MCSIILLHTEVRAGPVVGSKAFRTYLLKRKNIAMAPVGRNLAILESLVKNGGEQSSYFKANLF